MKINGALKPRHGASCCSKGSSPGAEQLRKYRDKKQQQQRQRYSRILIRKQAKKEATTTTITTATAKIFKKSYENNKKQQQQHHNHDVAAVDGKNQKNSIDANENDDAVDVHNDYVNNNNNHNHNNNKNNNNNNFIDEVYEDDEDDDYDYCGVNNQENNQSEQQHQEKTQPLSEQKSFKECFQYSLSSKQGLSYNTNNKTKTLKRKLILTTLLETDWKVQKNKKEKQINITTTRQVSNKNNKHNNFNNKPIQKEKEQTIKQPSTIKPIHITPTKGNSKQAIRAIELETETTTTTTALQLNNRSLSCKEVATTSNSNQLWQFSTIYEISSILWSAPLLTASLIISTIFKQLIQFWISLCYFFFMFSLKGHPVLGICGGLATIRNIRNLVNNNMRVPQSFCLKTILKSRPRSVKANMSSFSLPISTPKASPHSRCNATTSRPLTSSGLCWLLVYGAAVVTLLMPQSTLADDGDNFFSPNGIALGETTTAEFDYASRGQKKFGDKCDNTLECGFPGSVCDAKKKSCRCTDDLPVTNHIDKCGKGATVNESCFFNEQCESVYLQTECRDGRCVCRFDMAPIWLKDGAVECKGRGDQKTPETYIDPAMIGVLIGMALMFIIICVVLRLFSQARWRENRTIFNTPNPRLMNVSLLRESKLLHGQERRGSRMSVRAPSRQPSMASLRPHSPNPSLGKTGSRSNSHGSNASATSLKSTRSNSVSPAVNNAHHERKGSSYHPHHQQQHGSHHHHHHQQSVDSQHQQHLAPGGHQHSGQPTTPQQTNIIANPVAESVTVEIIEPEK